MKPDVYGAQDATAMAALVRNREVHPHELLDAALVQLETYNPQLNAVIARFEGEARQAIDAGLPDGPLKGVPFLVKDIGVAVRGHTTADGSSLFVGGAPDLEDSANVAAYRKCGLVIYGKTNTPELGITPVTEPAAFGATLNPWDVTRTCGGSSGGAAAAVAAGLVPAAHASDGGGSIRIPASCCGLFGLKPSRGRVSAAPYSGGWSGLSVQHAVTRSVRDSAVLLDETCRPNSRDSFWISPPDVPYTSVLERDPQPLRIAFMDGSIAGGLGVGIDPQCAKAVRQAAQLCESLGHHVEEGRPEIDTGALSRAFGVLFCAAIAYSVDSEGGRRGLPVMANEVERLTWQAVLDGRKPVATDYIGAMAVLQSTTRAVSMFFDRFDILMLSTLGKTPIPLGSLDPNRADLSNYWVELGAFMPNTQLFNVTGQPAMSVPLASSEEGWPIGVQFVGRATAEATLFSLAAQLERVSPWADRRPSLSLPSNS